MQDFFAGANVALCLVMLLLRIHEVRRVRAVVNSLHAMGEHRAATIVRAALVPGDLPTLEQIELMRRDEPGDAHSGHASR